MEGSKSGAVREVGVVVEGGGQGEEEEGRKKEEGDRRGATVLRKITFCFEFFELSEAPQRTVTAHRILTLGCEGLMWTGRGSWHRCVSERGGSASTTGVGGANVVIRAGRLRGEGDAYEVLVREAGTSPRLGAEGAQNFRERHEKRNRGVKAPVQFTLSGDLGDDFPPPRRVCSPVFCHLFNRRSKPWNLARNLQSRVAVVGSSDTISNTSSDGHKDLHAVALECRRRPRAADSNAAAVQALAGSCLAAVRLYNCNLSTDVAQALASSCPNLADINLRGCTNITDAVVQAIVSSCPNLATTTLAHSNDTTAFVTAADRTGTTAPVSLETTHSCHCPWPGALDPPGCGLARSQRSHRCHLATTFSPLFLPAIPASTALSRDLRQLLRTHPRDEVPCLHSPRPSR